MLRKAVPHALVMCCAGEICSMRAVMNKAIQHGLLMCCTVESSLTLIVNVLKKAAYLHCLSGQLHNFVDSIASLLR